MGVGVDINLIYDASTANAPAGFKAAMQVAASYLDSLITSNITVNIDVGWGEVNGTAVTGNSLGEAEMQQSAETYARVVSNLKKNATTADDKSVIANLPATNPFANNSIEVSLAQQKAWGLISATGTEVDGFVGFSTTLPFTFDPNNRAVSGEYDFIGVAEHELAHALGRFSEDGNGGYTVLDLLKYGSPGVIAQTPQTASYFSVNGGNTQLIKFDNSNSGDPGDWASSVTGDSFQSFNPTDLANVVTSTDIRLMDVIGYTVGTTSAPPSGVGAGPPNNFMVTDTSTTGSSAGWSGQAQGETYAGPVTGLSNEIIIATADNINVTAEIPNVFIHTGGGDDALDVSKVNGNNILDGSTGSNFLVGGTGTDTFYLDDRNPTASIWSTIVNFHSGDNATVWGVTPGDFNVTWVGDTQGAVGFTGLTGDFASTGKPMASITLAGLTSADLINGKLAISFGTTGNLPGLPGSSYMLIHAT